VKQAEPSSRCRLLAVVASVLPSLNCGLATVQSNPVDSGSPGAHHDAGPRPDVGAAGAKLDAAAPAGLDASTPAGPDAAAPAGLDASAPVRPLTVTVTANGAVPLPLGAFVRVDAQHQGIVDVTGTITWSDVPAISLTVMVTAPDCSQASQSIDALTTSVPVSVTCTAAGVDAIDLSKASVYNSPPDIASWAITTAITRLDIGSDGVYAQFDKSDGPNRWPDITPPGWGGSLQYTLWLALHLDNQWDTAGIIQFWYGRPGTGDDVTQNNQIAVNWVFDGRWGPMAGHQPAVGELVGFFVTAGNERGVTDASQTLVTERSNVVVIPFPANSGVSFVFGPAAPACGAIASGAGLASGQGVSSCDGRFQLTMQGDGNLVLNQSGASLWASATPGNPGASLSMQTDGNLVVSTGGSQVWASNTPGNPGASLAIQNDGNVVIYASGTPLWSTGTAGH
jgi:hypothetical protein